MLRKGAYGYLAHIQEKIEVLVELRDVLIVKKFGDVFPEKFPVLPPQREVEFSIEIMPGANPISIPSYRMAPAKLRELKIQLQELLDRGCIRPSMSKMEV